MIDTTALKNSILDLAFHGKLTSQNVTDGSAEELYNQICDEKRELIKSGKIKKNKIVPIKEEDIPFEIPNNWKWIRWGDLSEKIQYGYNASAKSEGRVKMVRISDIQDNKVLWDTVPYCEIDEEQIPEYLLKENDILFARTGGTVGKSYIVSDVSEDAVFAGYLIRTSYSNKLSSQYMKYFMESKLYWKQLRNGTIATAQPNCNGQTLSKMMVPLPPYAEQVRIIETIEKAFAQIDVIDSLQQQYSSDLEVLKSKIIDAGIRGKLTEQLPEDGTAEELSKNHIDDIINQEEKVLDIPSNWSWIKLGWAMEIERGGSPRPIKAFVTDADDGINWIKIGDVAKDGKYIYQTKEKIKPEGEQKSRKVYPGDFLLTNSMSFGRPYISKIEGCIHDGWLLLRNTNELFDLDYLYWLLSSGYAFKQFSKKAAGATVDNLNKDKVASAVIPLPPLSEQKRIANVLEEIMNKL